MLAASIGVNLRPIYQQVPVRVMPLFHIPGEPAALVYLAIPAAGLLDGDGYLVEIDARQGTSALVTGQSANRIQPAIRSFGTQHWRIRAASGSQLVLFLGPKTTIEDVGIAREHRSTFR